jgi:hypothetical protein
VQSEKACDEDDDDDDADDVEDVHGVLRLRHARFQHESAALSQERPGVQVCSAGAEVVSGKGGQFYTEWRGASATTEK